MTMQFLKQNFFDTTTLATVNDGTSTVENLFDRDINTKYARDINTGTAQQDIVVSLSAATVISKIFLQNHNLKNFSIFYDATTTNQFSPNISKTTNSETSNYFDVTSVTVSSITLRMLSTTSGGNSVTVGQLYLGNTVLSFERNPRAADYRPTIQRKQVLHKMPNGGVVQFIVDEKFKADIKWKFVTNSFTTQLLNVYETGSAFYFVPFPTSTSWDGRAHEVVWANAFDFRHSSNNKDAGQGGKIQIMETS